MRPFAGAAISWLTASWQSIIPTSGRWECHAMREICHSTHSFSRFTRSWVSRGRGTQEIKSSPCLKKHAISGMSFMFLNVWRPFAFSLPYFLLSSWPSLTKNYIFRTKTREKNAVKKGKLHLGHVRCLKFFQRFSVLCFSSKLLCGKVSVCADFNERQKGVLRHLISLSAKFAPNQTKNYGQLKVLFGPWRIYGNYVTSSF